MATKQARSTRSIGTEPKSTGRARPKDHVCIYESKEYSNGSVICQAGKKYVCTGLGWTKVTPVETC